MFSKAQYFILFIFFLIGKSLIGQQEAQFAHNMFNQVATNPGFVGYGNAICFTGIVHQQWVGFTNAEGDNINPQTQNISLHSPIKFLHGGLGLNIVNDQLGPYSEIGLKLMYAYRKDIGMGNLGIGLQVGLLNGSFSSSFNPADSGDPVITQEGSENNSSMLLDLGFGIHYAVPGRYYVGISSTRLSESQTPDDVLSYKTRRHYYLTGGYDYTLPFNPAYQLSPSLFIKSDGTDMHYTLATLVKYNNNVWGGVSYSTIRILDPLHVLLGFKIKEVTVAYSYGIPLSPIGSSGTHEVMLGYCFKLDLDKGESNYRNTRFL